MFSTDRSLPAPSLFASLPPLCLSHRFDDMASTPVSSIASSATNVADVLASLGNDELAAEVGSWSAELQAKVVAAVSALSSTSTSTSASTVVRRRKSNKLDAASSSTAASWLAPAVEPADLSAELTAIQEGERSPAATTIADDEVINFGAMQTRLGNPPVVVVDFSGATGPDLGGPEGSGADAGGHGGARRPLRLSWRLLAAMEARPRRLLPRRLRPRPHRRSRSLRLRPPPSGGTISTLRLPRRPIPAAQSRANRSTTMPKGRRPSWRSGAV